MDSARPAADEIIVSLPDLLWATRCSDIDELSDAVYDDSDIDTWVDDVGIGVLVRTTGCATELRYPFTLADFWEVVAEIEDDHLRSWAD